MSCAVISSRRSARGMALVMVLLVVALMSIVATQLGSLVHRNIQQTSNREQYQQAYWFAVGGERLARSLIATALDLDGRSHLGQTWANPLLLYPIEGGTIRLQISDQRTCFNLNALSGLNTPQGGNPGTQPKALVQLQSLLRLEGMAAFQVSALIEPVRDWVDSDTLPTGLGGAEDLHYTGKETPYLPGNTLLVDTSELNLIDVFSPIAALSTDPDDPTPATLRHWFCALPDADLKLNLNSLGSEQVTLLAALFEGKVANSQLEDWLSQRPDDGFADVDAFWSYIAADPQLSGQVDAAVKDQLMVSSEFFLVRVEVNYYDANLVLYTRIFVRNGRSTAYQRHYGVLNG